MRADLPRDSIVRQYLEEKKSCREIARKYHTGKAVIKRLLLRSGVKLRTVHEALILTNRRHTRNLFCGSSKESAYMLGLVTGDLTPFKKSEYTLRVITNSTHLSLINLVRETFAPYGNVRINPTKDKNHFGWRVWADLEKSGFEFLLQKKQVCIPSFNDDEFFSFLAGLIDSDGSVIINRARAYCKLGLRIFNEDKKLLDSIHGRLISIGYHPIICRSFKAGEKRTFGHKELIYRRDYFTLELCRRFEVSRILQCLPLRHSEKKRRKELALRLIQNNVTSWRSCEQEVGCLRAQIRSEAELSLLKSRTAFLESH